MADSVMADSLTLTSCLHDFQHLTQSRDALLKKLLQFSDQGSQHREMMIEKDIEEGEGYRFVFPHGVAPVQELLHNQETPNPAWFVGFFSDRQTDIPEEINNKVNNLDDDLMAALPMQQSILAYTTGFYVIQSKPVAFNFVLLRGPEAIESWRGLSIHDNAVKDLSHHYYNRVRIHAGQLEWGLHFDVFNVEHTIFLDYGDYRRTGQIHRHMKVWPELENKIQVTW